MLNYGGYGLGLIFQAQDLASDTMRVVERNLQGVSKTADRAAESFADSMKMMRTGLVGMGVGAGVVVGLQRVGQAAFDTATMFREQTAAFTLLLGSSEQAQAHIGDLQKFAETTPFEFLELTQYSRQLQAYGFEASQIIPMLTKAGDAAAALQDPQALGQIIDALGKVQAKGQMTSRELISLATAGIPIYQIMQEELGLTAEQVGKLGAQGIKAGEAIDAVLRGLENRYSGMMNVLLDTPQGIIRNIGDYATTIKRAIGEPIYDSVVRVMMRLRDALADISQNYTAGLQSIGKGFANLVSMITPVVDGVLAVTRALVVFIDKRPWIGSFITTFVGIVGAVTLVAGAFVFLKGLAGTLPMLFSKIGLGGKLAFAQFIPWIAVASVAIGGLHYAMERDVGGIGTLWKGIAAMISGTRFDPEMGWVTEISAELRKGLADAGLLDAALSVWMFVTRIREAFRGLADGLAGFGTRMREAFTPLLTGFGKLFDAITKPFRRAVNATQDAANELPLDSFYAFGQHIGQAMQAIAPVLEGLFSFIGNMLAGIGAVLSPIVSVVVDVIEWIGAAAGRIFGTIGDPACCIFANPSERFRCPVWNLCEPVCKPSLPFSERSLDVRPPAGYAFGQRATGSHSLE
jgi:tape measure domain-containing protein